MPTLIIFKIIAAAFIFAIGLVAVLYPLKTRREIAPAKSLVFSEAFASGLFLGVAFFHMLPYSITLFQYHLDTLDYPVPEMICAGGFLLLLFLERLYIARASSYYSRANFPIFLLIILIIHTLTEGIALGIGQNVLDTLAIFIAIAAYKGSASFALCMTLLRTRLPIKQMVALVIFFSLMTPIGITIGITLNHFIQSKNGEILLASFNAFAAGAFLYMSIMYLIQFHQRLNEEQTSGMSEFACFALALIAMALLSFWD